MVIRATPYFLFGDILVLSLHFCAVSALHFPEITWMPNNVASRFTSCYSPIKDYVSVALVFAYSQGGDQC